MAVADEISNNDLDERVGLRLHGSDRRLLNESGLVASYQAGRYRTYVHVLTDKGWAWCSAELSGPRPEGSTPAMRVLYELLRSLDRHLKRTDLALADIFTLATRDSAGSGAAAPPDDLTSRVKAVYGQLVGGGSRWVALADLRDALDTDRAELDRTLEALFRASTIELIPEVNKKVLTERCRRAALTIGGESKELIAIADYD